MDFNEFAIKIKKANIPKKHEIRNSYGTIHAYRYYLKQCTKSKTTPIDEKLFRKIINYINSRLVKSLFHGEDIIFPYRLGSLKLRKANPKSYFDKGKLKITYPIDWGSTLKLWNQDEESYKDKVLVRHQDRDVYKLYYSKTSAYFKNMYYITFRPSRSIKSEIRKRVENNDMEAFSCNQ